MASSTKQQRLEALARQEAELKARKADLIAQLAKEERKLDTRRKILVGALVMTHAGQDEKFARWLAGFLNKTLAKEQDRVLLNDFLTAPAAPVASPVLSQPDPANGFSPASETVAANLNDATPQPASGQPSNSFEKIFSQPQSA